MKQIASFIILLIILCVNGCSKKTSPMEPVDNKIEQWREDLQFLATQMPLRHVNLFHSISEEEFQNEIETLDNEISELSDNEIILGFMKIVASISSQGRDGHTHISPFQPAINFRALPLVAFHFKDGIFIVNSRNIPNDHIGSKIIQIGNLSMDDIIELSRPYIPKDNEYSFKQIFPIVVMIPEILHALGIIEETNSAKIVVESPNGGTSILELTAINPEEYLSFFPEISLLGLPQKPEPLYVSNLGEIFWKTYLQDSKTLYFQYNGILPVNNSGQTISEFSNELQAFIETEDVKKLIVDVRQNIGGDNTTYAPLVEMLKNNRLNQEGRLFVLFGRGTFSAASNFIMKLENETNAIFAGEPSGGSPNHYGDALELILPNSKIVIGVSSVYHQDAAIDDDRLFKSPDILIELESKDYFSGIDPVMDAVLKE